MPNPYVNKVVQSNGTTLIDISDTTAVAADVASGKYFYLATGEKVVGTASGGGGYDIPTFTITFDSSYSTVLSVTCDKTYANCLSIFNSGNNTAMSLITAQGTSDEFYGGVTVTATGTGVITYTGYNVAHPAFDIVYNSNGTMSYVEPSAFVDTLNVTVNGTYYADGDKDWTEVNVNVSGGTPSATQHTILFEFEDNTNTTITAYWDGTFISDAIRATTPRTYNNKTVTLAQLDGTTWYSYDPSTIPLNTQLIDFTKVANGYIADATWDNGVPYEYEWASVSDFTEIDPSMTFSYIGFASFFVCFYDSSKTFISGFKISDDTGESDGHPTGTLTPAKIPANAKYVRIDSMKDPDATTMSLIRTA